MSNQTFVTNSKFNEDFRSELTSFEFLLFSCFFQVSNGKFNVPAITYQNWFGSFDEKTLQDCLFDCASDTSESKGMQNIVTPLRDI